jgi:nicotinate-nucleotide pyrophosphorylase (carboxylating)
MNVLNRDKLAEFIALARNEDFGDGDVSAQLMGNAGGSAQFRLVAKDFGVFSGVEVGGAVLQAYDPGLTIEWNLVDGSSLHASSTQVATIRGPLGSALSAERVLLNFLQRLCGVATLTHRFVEAVAGTPARIYDTRKTIPGWRALDKYAVRCGGGFNHRMGLFDAVMIKDNHLTELSEDRLAGGVFEMLNRLAESSAKPSFVAVEADTLGQVLQLLKVVGIDVIILDNFSTDELTEAVVMRERGGLAGKIEFEASGGVSLATVESIARTGVERISVGALTHSAAALDLSLERI